MINIRAPSIGYAHEQAIFKIMSDGIKVVTEDKEETFELPEPLNIHVATPMEEPRISPCNMFGTKSMEEYVNKLLTGETGDFSYTYHDRIFKYPSFKKDTTIDQIAGVMAHIIKEQTTRRAQAITWIPDIDIMSKNPPCLQRIQFLLRNSKLNMYVEFRSRDILSAMGANIYALTRLQQMVANRLGTKIGWYSDTSVSAHIYYKRDEYELKKYYSEQSYKRIKETLEW